MQADQFPPIHLPFIIIAVALAVFRIGGVKNKSFQAVAHLFVAWVFAAWWYNQGQFYLWVGVALSVVEVICAAYKIIQKRRTA